ncbi:MAG: epoxide hydrolase [Rhodospirillaceae bacterium]|nr:MAG: epoxide hydrolase [Rhodospirillaceae bacterium]
MRLIKRPRVFEVSIPQQVLDTISAKLALAHLTYAPADSDPWRHGMSAQYLGEFLDYWRHSYDWRSAEGRLNRFPQFKVQVEDIDIHYYHLRGSGRAPRPLILTHGWPGSIIEFIDVIERLAHPERFGGHEDDGFDVVVPSLPGYAFSSRPSAPIGPRRVAQLWRRLMVDILGYERFFAQGGDWGAAVTCWLGSDHPDCVSAIHINLFLGPPPADAEDAQTRAWRQSLEAVQSRESGYAHLQMTRPQTIGLALSDTPLGFAAWVLEKFQRWGDTKGDIESRFDKDTLITNIMLYLVNGAVASSLWMYYGANEESPRYADRVCIPVGVALFPGEFLPMAPRAAMERVLNIKRWTRMKAGGHFAALEEPAAFADEVRAFFRETSINQPTE